MSAVSRRLDASFAFKRQGYVQVLREDVLPVPEEKFSG